jgi:hypothetical protein
MKAPLSIMTLGLLLTLPLAADPQDPHFFSVDFPEDGDTFMAYDGLKTEAYGEDAQFLQFEFEGRIGVKGKSIRVVWTGGDGGKDDYTLGKYKAGETAFVYRASAPLKNLGFGSNAFRFIATFQDGVKTETTVTLYVLHGHMGERAKPVIYLYPTSEQTVSVTVRPAGGVTKSIPELGAGWTVTARPDGRLTDKATGRDYPYLFWESHETAPPEPLTEGFVVKADQIDGFFGEKLAVLGLNAIETKDFLDFWREPLQASPYVLLFFHPADRIEREAPLEVWPRPDSVIRVYFEFRPLTQPVKVTPQVLVPRQRTGFAVVEWGGRRP